LNSKDEILKCLREEDLPESMDLIIDLSKQLTETPIENEAFFIGDGLDLIRWLLKYHDGINILPPMLKRNKSLILRYLQKRLKTMPEISSSRLSRETGICGKVIREYLKEIKVKK